MIDLSRRGFLIGMSAAVAAPAVIRLPGLLMPIKPFTETLLLKEELYAIGLDRSYYNASVEPLPNGGVYTLPKPKGPGSLLRIWNSAYHRDPQSIVKVEDPGPIDRRFRFAYNIRHSTTFESYDGISWRQEHSQSDAPRQLTNNGYNLRSS